MIKQGSILILKSDNTHSFSVDLVEGEDYYLTSLKHNNKVRVDKRMIVENFIINEEPKPLFNNNDWYYQQLLTPKKKMEEEVKTTLEALLNCKHQIEEWTIDKNYIVSICLKCKDSYGIKDGKVFTLSNNEEIYNKIMGN